MNITPKRIEVGIDWLASTFASTGTDDAEWWSEALDFAEKLQAQGESVREGQLLGYRGIYVGRLFVGQRDDGSFVRATGAFALDCFNALYRPEMHVSRLDLQVTCWFDPGAEEMGLWCKWDAERHNKSLPKPQRRKITTYENNQGGFTLYVGSRTSAHYCRIYNKYAESKSDIYRNAWRWELELHNAAATLAAISLYQQEQAPISHIASTVKDYYNQRGIRAPWQHVPGHVLSYAVDRHETDDETSLKWLSTQVRPTVARLCRRGYTNDVLQALGLEHLFNIGLADKQKEAL